MTDLILLGRFPPPYDGESLATARLVDLIEDQFSVVRIDTNVPAAATRAQQISRALETGDQLTAVLKQYPEATLVWTSISPSTLGHARDRATIFPRIRDRRTIAVVHRQFAPLFESPVTGASARRAVQGLDMVVFLDEDLKKACSQWIPQSRSVVISNTVDREFVLAPDVSADRAGRHPHSPFRILFLSNMIPSKGYGSVLDAVQLLTQDEFPARLDLVGNWYSAEDRTIFENRIDTLGLRDRVTIHGSIPDRRRIREFYTDADVFVLPTCHPTEAQPVSILEALSAGTPIITTRHGGIPNMVADRQEAHLVPPEDPEAIAAAVRLLADPNAWRRMAEACRKRFDTFYHPDAVARKWVELISSIGSR